MDNRTSARCLWCERPFRARRGGSPQRFCCAAHRLAFWSALRRWGERSVASGMLTVAELRNDTAAACTLLPSGNSPAPVSGPQTSAAHPGEAEALLDELLAVRSEGWRALAAAMSEELIERLKRWRRGCLMKNQPQFLRSAL
jgi:hypothetical protein